MLFSLMFQQCTAFKYNVLLKMLSINLNGKLEIKYLNSLLFFHHRNCSISWFLELQINWLQNSFVGSDFFISGLTYSVWVDTTEWFKKKSDRDKKKERKIFPPHFRCNIHPINAIDPASWGSFSTSIQPEHRQLCTLKDPGWLPLWCAED